MALQRLRKMTHVDVYSIVDSVSTRFFADQCAGVFDLYSVHLASNPAPIKATTSLTRIFVDARVRPGAPSRIWPETADSFDGMRCAIEPSILAADESARPFLYLDWLHERMMELAHVRGWDTQPLVAAFEACRAAQCELRLEGRPKNSPDRQHIAHLQMTRNPRGQAEITLSIHHRRTGDLVGQTTSVGRCEARDFRRMTRQMRWTSTTEVVANDDDGTMPGLYQLLAAVGIVQAAPMIRPDWPKLAADAAVAAGLDPEVFDDMPDCPEPEVIADADVEYEPDVLVPPTIYFAGGGPSTPDHEYDRVLSAALEPLATSEEWAQWWAAGNQPPCEIWYWIGGPSTQIRIHRNDRRVAVRIKRAADQAHPHDLNPDPGADAARIDAESVITKLRDRFGLGPPPALIAPATKIQSRRLP